ncbi:MAG: hypothetical protein HDS66_07115 [Bacteroidales bacterium]|nr:hypothetical protein [Bacteroidales bacterium]
MKRNIFAIALVVMALSSCSKKQESPKHEAPTFLVVVDSICNKYATEDGYNASEVKKGMHDFVDYYAANENPIFKDTPMTLTGINTANALDGSKFVTSHFTYNFEEPTDNGKRVYSLNVIIENEYAATDSIPLVEGETYIITPDGGLVQYDGMLDMIGIEETQGGNVVDSRSFGSLKIKGASFKSHK